MKMTREERRALMRRLRHDANVIAKHFKLGAFNLLECDERMRSTICQQRFPGGDGKLAFGLPEREACMGCCFWIGDHFRVCIRLYNRRNGRPRAYSYIADTLCHELAHVATPDDCLGPKRDGHGDEFQYAYDRIYGFARAEEIIEPAAYER